jgi:beta-N-acetylhexosaminidase
MNIRITINIIFIVILFYSPPLYGGDVVSRYVDGMTLKQKIGQLILIGLPGKDLDKKDISHIKKIQPGGIIFYRRNLNEASDIQNMVCLIKNIFHDPALPMFFAVDQEGWIVHRIAGDLYLPPSAPAVGAAHSERLAEELGIALGKSLSNLGININLAPVLDVPSGGENSPMARRSFSDDFDIVAKLGIAYLRGIKAAGLLATAKHFPGIGRTHDDTHNKLAHIVWKSQEEKKRDVAPFLAAIEAGVDIVMAGHVIAEPGDSVEPVSLSSYWMRNVLREEMGFNGLILVDNIEMKAIERNMSVAQAAVQAFKAGADLIMISHERKNQEAVFRAIVDAVNKGDISVPRLEESLRRIIAAKIGVLYRSAKKDSSYDLGTLSRMIAERSIVELRMKESSHSPIGEDQDVLYVGNNISFFAALQKVFEKTEILKIPLQDFKKLAQEVSIQEILRDFDMVIVDAGYQDAEQIVSLCRELYVNYVVVLRNPLVARYTLERLAPKRLLITFDNSNTHFRAAAEILSGKRMALGRLPYDVRLPEIYMYTYKREAAD